MVIIINVEIALKRGDIVNKALCVLLLNSTAACVYFDLVELYGSHSQLIQIFDYNIF